MSHNFSQAWQTSQVRDTFSWGKTLLQSQHFSQAVQWRQRRHRSDSLGITASYLCPNNIFFLLLPHWAGGKRTKKGFCFWRRSTCALPCVFCEWMDVCVCQWRAVKFMASEALTLSLFVLQTDQPYRPLLYNIWLAPTLTLVALLHCCPLWVLKVFTYKIFHFKSKGRRIEKNTFLHFWLSEMKQKQKQKKPAPPAMGH